MKPDRDGAASAVLELTVNNHAGALSHVCGLFARRAFNLDAMLCVPVGNARYSRIWLRVSGDDRLEHLQSQLRKLHDVHEVRRRRPGRAEFDRIFGDGRFTP